MQDPVSTCDGQVYERSAIEDWFRRGRSSSPFTGLELAALTLTPQPALQAAISAFMSHPAAKQDSGAAAQPVDGGVAEAAQEPAYDEAAEVQRLLEGLQSELRKAEEDAAGSESAKEFLAGPLELARQVLASAGTGGTGTPAATGRPAWEEDAAPRPGAQPAPARDLGRGRARDSAAAKRPEQPEARPSRSPSRLQSPSRTRESSLGVTRERSQSYDRIPSRYREATQATSQRKLPARSPSPEQKSRPAFVAGLSTAPRSAVAGRATPRKPGALYAPSPSRGTAASPGPSRARASSPGGVARLSAGSVGSGGSYQQPSRVPAAARPKAGPIASGRAASLGRASQPPDGSRPSRGASPSRVSVTRLDAGQLQQSAARLSQPGAQRRASSGARSGPAPPVRRATLEGGGTAPGHRPSPAAAPTRSADPAPARVSQASSGLKLGPATAPGATAGTAAPAAPAPTDGAGRTPLMHAAGEGDIAVLRALMESGSQVNATDECHCTALMYAATYGHADAVRVLVENGAHIEATSQDGWTPLITASYNGHSGVVRCLLEQGANVDASDERGWTSLMHVAFSGDNTTLRCLLEFQASVSALDADGRDALVYAAFNGHHDNVASLLDRMRGQTQEHCAGDTAVLFAAIRGHEAVLHRLLDSLPSTTAETRHAARKLALDHGHAGVVELLRQRSTPEVAP